MPDSDPPPIEIFSVQDYQTRFPDTPDLDLVTNIFKNKPWMRVFVDRDGEVNSVIAPDGVPR